MAAVTITGVHKQFGSTPVIRGVDIAIEDGEFCVLVGPSGCGKSTLLRMIAGLEEITQGEIAIGGRVVNRVPPKERDIAMVFQNYALYPHMTVRDNMSFALTLAKQPKDVIEAHVKKAADILGLAPYLDRYPRQLSGGQRQRVAMGRAIVRDPQVFLFDEPLSNLDAKLRVQMRAEIKELHQRLKTTSIYVTHDQIEAMTMADKIVVMRDGLIEQQGDALGLYDRPVNTFVAGFIGSPAMNMIPGVVRDGGRVALRRRGDAAAAGGRARRSRPRRALRHPSRALHARRHGPARRRRRRRADRRRHAALLPLRRAGGDGDDPRPHRLPSRRPDSPRARPCAARTFSTRRAECASPPDVPIGHRTVGAKTSTTGGGSHESVQASQVPADRRRRSPPGPRPARSSGSRTRNAQWSNTPEKGAKLRVLRWSRFVQGDIDRYMVNVKTFQDKYGIEVRVDNEGWEDVRPKAAVAANTGAGPDIILSTNDDANLYPEKLVDVTDVCTYLGAKYGGWYPVCDPYLRPDGKKWIGVPLGVAGVAMVYRESHMKAAGFDTFPKDTDGFLKLCKALKEKGTPPGFALGNATGDGNTWCQWLVWAFGGKLVDTNNKVVIDSPETVKALEYVKEHVRVVRARHAVVARPEQQQGVPRRPDLAHQQRDLDLLRGEELAGSEGQGDGRGHLPREHADRARRAGDASSSCSSTR